MLLLTLHSGSRKYTQVVMTALVPAQKKAVLPFQFQAVGLIMYGSRTAHQMAVRLYELRASTTVWARSWMADVSEMMA